MESLINTAIRARKGIIPDKTDAYRLFDGAGDGRDGTFSDTFAGHWLGSYRGAWPDEVRASGARRKSLWFKRLDQENKAAPQCAEGDPRAARCTVKEHAVRYLIDFSAGYSQGLFLDQRDNRREVMARAAGERLLNCFSYTCGFSVAAAVAGAEATTSLDLSKPYLEWGKANFAANGIDLGSSEHYFCRGEAFEWMGQFAKKGRRFGGVILDPPSFSRAKGRGTFRVEKDYAMLVEAGARVLGKGGWLLACTNHRGLSARAFREMVREGLLAAGKRSPSLEMRPMPPDFTGEPYLKSVWVET